MKIKHSDVEIPLTEPFANCKLERKKYGEILTNIIESYADGFVLAINNEWGTGKTTFVKMWQQQLKNKGLKTLYFNAWENDFDNNPLVAIMSELKALTDKSEDDTFKSLLKKGAILTKNVLPSVVKAIAGRYLDTKALIDSIENTTSAVVEILKDEIDEFAKKKKGLVEFRNELEYFIRRNSNGTPIVFVIDELDRCRPNYAVEALEYIKHFFNVTGIIFVLSIDKVQLGHAVRGVYGSEQLNANEYLRRFIDLEYSLPLPDTKVFCTYLYDYFNFDDFFSSKKRLKYTVFHDDRNSLITICSILFEKANLSLRQQEKIFAHARLALRLFKENNFLFPNTFVILLFLRTYENEFYTNIKLKKLTLETLVDEFAKTLPKGLRGVILNYFINVEVMLVLMYNNYLSKTQYRMLLKEDENTHEKTSIINSKLESSGNNEKFNRYLIMLEDDWGVKTLSIEYFLNKIDLLCRIT